MSKMKNLFFYGVSAMALAATPAVAFEVTGGEVGLEYNHYSDADASVTKLNGSVEFGFDRNFGMQIDAEAVNVDEDEGSASANRFGVHGIYHLSGNSSLGLFYGQEEDADFYGIEYGVGTAQSGFEIYLGQATEADEDALLFGFSGEYALGNGFSLELDYASATDEVTLYNLSLGGKYRFQPNFAGYVEFGSLGVAVENAYGNLVTADTNYVGVGLEYTFGAKRGATFNNRSVIPF